MKINNYPNYLVPIELAEKLKNIGFNKPCLIYSAKHIQISKDLFIAFKDKIKVSITSIYLKYCEQYTNSYFKKELKNINVFSIPTWEQVLEWFREKNLIGTIEYEDFYPDNKTYYYAYCIINKLGKVLFYSPNYDSYKTYEEARESLVNKLIEIYKNENNTVC